MKNLAIGFVIGYLVCTFIFGGAGAVGSLVEQSFGQVSIWWSQGQLICLIVMNRKVDIELDWLYNNSILRRHI